ncbi:MAG: pantoate--beta-alanine ligase [Spirochaetia bacterium]|nr:pantoate--beta-alanine ligase [Spirochaetia bacterium]
MKVITKINEMQTYINKMKKRHTIGFVPTMGALHQGHMSLVAAAAGENSRVVVSIFVNPTQFAAGEDLEKYPRPIKKDLKMMKDSKLVACVFKPEAADMYPEGFASYVALENDMPQVLCGVTRPSHFKGVTTVIAKLLNIIKPDRLYLGQKDAQQAFILEKMMKDLNYETVAVICPTVREKDGLAMSSRNSYLTPEQRNTAPVLYTSLQMAESMIELGERNPETVKKEVRRKLKESQAEIDYVEIIEAGTLKRCEKLCGRVLIAAAICIGKTRLIDNIIMDIKD